MSIPISIVVVTESTSTRWSSRRSDCAEEILEPPFDVSLASRRADCRQCVPQLEAGTGLDVPPPVVPQRDADRAEEILDRGSRRPVQRSARTCSRRRAGLLPSRTRQALHRNTVCPTIGPQFERVDANAMRGLVVDPATLPGTSIPEAPQAHSTEASARSLQPLCPCPGCAPRPLAERATALDVPSELPVMAAGCRERCCRLRDRFARG